MGTSGGEPKTLLNALKPMLGSSGDIKSPQEVVRIVSLMRDAEKLMSRCVYMNILKSTISMAKENKQSNETLEKFVSIGGWAVLNKWLSDGKKTDNFSILKELLEVLKELPISVDTLKQGNMGKIVKYLTKVDNQDVKKLSSGVLRQWMSLVRTKSGPEKTEKFEKIKQIDDNLETGSQASDSSSDIVLIPKESNSEAKSAKRLREVQQGDSNSPLPEKKAKSEGKMKIKKESKVIAIESAGFMNALTTAAVPAPVKKRKRTAASTQKTSVTPTTTTTTSSSGASKPAFSGGILEEILSNQSQTHGYEERDRLKSKGDDSSAGTNGKASTTDENATQNGSPQVGDAADFTKDSENADKDKAADSNSSTPSTTTTDDVDVEPPPAKKPNKKGRCVTWAEDHKLASYHYFEMDEDERATIRHPINFINAAHQEMMHERELLEKAKRLNEDKMLEKVKWYRPREITGIATPVESGSKSEEKKIQKERESSVLADIFFSKSSLPDSPAEPDIEHDKKVTGEPKVIPHDEKGTTHLPPKQAATTTAPATTAAVQLPAALASLFSAAPSTNPPPSADPVSVQSLLDKIMSTSGSQSNPLNQLLTNVKQQQQQQLQEGGSQNPNALKNILEPLQNKPGGPRPTGIPGMGLLGVGPGESGPAMNQMGPPGQFGPRGPRGPLFRPDARPRFQGPGGPRPNGPFQEQIRGGQMPPRMLGPRPLIPELGNREDFPDEQEVGEGDDGPNMRGRGRGGPPRGRGRGRSRGRGPAPICRHFVSQRGCLRGDSCHFLHPGINGPPL